MVGGISNLSAYYNPYQSVYSAAQKQPVQNTQPSAAVWTAQRAAQPESPVQPVTPARPVNSGEDPAQAAMLRYASDPAEMAVRMRIQYPDSAAQQAQTPIMGEAKAVGSQQADAPARPARSVSTRTAPTTLECPSRPPPMSPRSRRPPLCGAMRTSTWSGSRPRPNGRTAGWSASPSPTTPASVPNAARRMSPAEPPALSPRPTRNRRAPSNRSSSNPGAYPLPPSPEPDTTC